MGVFTKELRANAKALTIWAIVMAFFMAVGTVKYSGAEGGGEAMHDLIDQFPRIVLAVFGMGDAAEVDITSFPGFYTVLWFYAAVIMAAAAVSFGRSAVLREVVDGTCEFLFVRPVARGRVLAAKLAAALVAVVVLAAVCGVASAGAYPTLGLDENHGALFVRAAVVVALLGVVFVAVGAACAAAARRPERGALAGNLTVVVAYLASVGNMMFSDQSWGIALRVLTPIRWVTPTQLAQGGFDVPFAVLACGVVAACLAVTFVCFSRRDLTER